ncbi:putative SEC26-coatomer complex beta chain of secretory pathway vesicles [Rhizophagus irregularis]|uniref:Coatomer subunit beta n=3 Tax=Glomeraceae TaxID=36751 RepID=A0A2N0RKH7_9GLOM|nr:putative SEC26-coatomer complex beta chain of secretory pathway vesicles [Rhizophagus irregularis]PKC63812.1 putative SEC26-coatomer complex beta chain of secretory pathway vesicles [Rhizophagus irregularis]PKK78742.1 putative SEC26-coatomer complex beta chain of secretory pathway vesicles [Rhizophagus irregularis]
MATDTCYTIIHQDDSSDQPSLQELKTALEKGSEEAKIETMKKILVTMLNGEPLPQILMHVIRFVMPSKSKALKKLLHFYWEICPKTNPDGKLKQEMILVCNALRNDLQHPNEYIRGATLRFLCKLREPELLEPLLPSCRSCLEHRHAYVRKNAVFAIYTIYKHFEYLIPDAPELIQSFLAAEADQTCKRNAFVMLCNTNQARAVEYLNDVFDQVPNFDELLQLSVIELIRKDCRNNSTNRGKYIRCIFDLLNAASHSVKYEAATSLMALTHAPAAVKAAASCYIELIIKESDNNVKLIVLDRLDELREKHDQTLDDLVLDILRVLTSPDIEVRRKALRIALELVTNRNVQEVVVFLKKELSKTLDQDYEKNNEYRQLLIQSIHGCAIKFSEVAANVVHVLMEFLGDSNNPAAVDVIAFVREVVEKFPNLRSSITEKLLETFMDVKSGKVFRGALWIVGEYCSNCKDIEEAWKQIRAGLGEIPILASEQRLLEEAEKENKNEEINHENKQNTTSSSRRILADGTYATETAFSSNSSTLAKLEAIKAAVKPPLRSLLLSGDFYLGSVLASTLTKLVLRYSGISEDPKKTNALRAEAMLIMASIIRVGQSQFASNPIDEDSYDRIMSCLHILEQISTDYSIKSVFLHDTRAAFARIVEAEEKRTAAKKAKDKSAATVQVDDLIVFRQFSKRNIGDEADEYELDLTRATGQADSRDDLISKLSRVVQLTGFSDPVYAEAYVNVHQYDILLDVLIVNQTSETLQNLSIEFATLGDLKLVERPTQHNLAPHSFHSVKATIKVSSTETGVIFGNIVYDGPGTSESNCVVLNDIHIDIMDYINPAYCNETQFRSMWTEFEWENKVNVNTNITDLREYLGHIMKSTNMSCLTPEVALSGDCGFLSANMYARSIFGEDALANISIEKQTDGAITGHVRIRSKTQGIALSLGDKITLGIYNIIL